MHGDRTHGIWPQVWSQHAPSIQSWEYKVNCGDASSHEQACFLSDLTSVVVTTPAGELIELEKTSIQTTSQVKSRVAGSCTARKTAISH